MIVPIALSSVALRQLATMQADGWRITWEQLTGRLELIVTRGAWSYSGSLPVDTDPTEWNDAVDTLTKILYPNHYDKTP